VDIRARVAAAGEADRAGRGNRLSSAAVVSDVRPLRAGQYGDGPALPRLSDGNRLSAVAAVNVRTSRIAAIADDQAIEAAALNEHGLLPVRVHATGGLAVRNARDACEIRIIDCHDLLCGGTVAGYV